MLTAEHHDQPLRKLLPLYDPVVLPGGEAVDAVVGQGITKAPLKWRLKDSVILRTHI